MRTVAVRRYGTKTLQRGRCSQCGEKTFMCFDGLSACCSAPMTPFSGAVKQEVTSSGERRRPSTMRQREILKEQKGRCFWCDKRFGSLMASPRGVLHVRRPVWDHYIPYWYTGSSDDNQFVAACARCNLYKAGHIPLNKQEENDLREHLKQRFVEQGWIDL